uniref:Uncharacterized protein n=1 Tax=Onchocerca volvulus TaxID=6282 RepID=A0A8R1TTJ4_ONCVO
MEKHGHRNNFPSVQEKIVLGSSDISKGQKVFINFAKQIYSSLVLVISFKKCKTYDSLKNEVGAIIYNDTHTILIKKLEGPIRKSNSISPHS